MISVIIPMYNAERTLQRCIESLKQQKLENCEIIFVNDGSTDNTMKILKEFAKTITNIVIVNKPNGGVSSARNAGIQIARGKYIAFMDVDDFYLDEEYLSNMIRCMEVTNADMAVSGITILKSDAKYEIDVQNKTESIVEFAKNLFQYSNQGIFNSPWNKVFRREKIESLFPESMSFGEDAVFVAKYVLNCESVVFCQGCGYGYEVVESSTTAEYRKNVRFDEKQTRKYYAALSDVWFKHLDCESALENYIKLKTQGVCTILTRMLKKDGIVQFLREDIRNVLRDDILEKNKQLIMKASSKNLHTKLCKCMLKNKNQQVKLLVLLKLGKTKFGL